LDNGNEIHNVNIAIASAVTAYARIHMSQFKNNNTLPRLFYTDTDSLYFEGSLPDSFISSTEIGKLKLEGIYDKAIFLAPKVYALKNSMEEIIKIKGLNEESILKNKIKLETLDKLLTEDSFEEIKQNKLFKNLDKGNINIIEQIYTLKATGNKRKLVYNEDGLLVGTSPLYLKNGYLNRNIFNY
jgi:DNA polymerase elongation subunit (family B)